MRRFVSSQVVVLAFASALATFAGTTGCASASDDDAIGVTSSAQTSVVDQAGNDVQVLQVWTAGKLFPNTAPAWNSATAGDVQLGGLGDATCVTLNSRESSSVTYRDVDCTDAFIGKAAWQGSQKSPAFDTIRWRATFAADGRQIDASHDFCQILELRTVTKDASLTAPSFAGIGFHTSRGPFFVEKADLHAVGHTTLKSGEAATVHRFVGISTCISGAHNSTSGNMYQTFDFKPYARFDLSPGEGDASFRVRESIDGNHRLGRSWPGSRPVVDSSGFNRENDLLQK